MQAPKLPSAYWLTVVKHSHLESLCASVETCAYYMYLVPDVACVLQPVGHGIIQILKCQRGDFLRRLISDGSCV